MLYAGRITPSCQQQSARTGSQARSEPTPPQTGVKERLNCLRVPIINSTAWAEWIELFCLLPLRCLLESNQCGEPLGATIQLYGGAVWITLNQCELYNRIRF